MKQEAFRLIAHCCCGRIEVAVSRTRERDFIGDPFPNINCSSGGRLRTPCCARPLAVDARQIEPHPLGGCVSFRPPSPPPPRRDRKTEEGDEDGMHVVRPRAAGLDVHKMEFTATVRLCEGEGEPAVETRCFSTLPSLEEMVTWLTGGSSSMRPSR